MGKRGESWVVAQVVLFIVFFTVPRTGGPWPYADSFLFAGWACFVIGLLFVFWSAFNLGRSLTPFPRPVAGGQLVTTGAYRIVRHPIYFGILMVALGIAMITVSPFRLVLTVLLFFFFDRKARREEHWLKEAYPDYEAYRMRVKCLIPWLY